MRDGDYVKLRLKRIALPVATLWAMHVKVPLRGPLTSPAWESQGTHKISIPLSLEIGQLLITHFKMQRYDLVPMESEEQFEPLKYAPTNDHRKDTDN